MNRVYNNIKRSLPSFVERSAQKQMIQTIEAVIPQREICCIQGPTGTGKTLGYCVGVIPLGLKLKRKVIISSATVALQEQILEKDMPMVKKHGGIDFQYVLAKGRSRYLCLEKLSTQSDQGSLHESGRRNQLTLRDLKRQFENGWSGDIDNLKGEIDKRLWSRVACDVHSCIKQGCHHYRECPFFKARAQMEDADVIIANHDLVLIDLKLGGGKFLPDVRDCIYVFDEAHHLPAKAKSQFTYACKTREIAPALIQMLQLLNACKFKDQAMQTYIKQIQGFAKACVERTNRFNGSLEAVRPQTFREVNGTHIWRFQHGILPERLAAAVGALLQPLERINKTCAVMMDYLRDAIKITADTYPDYMAFHSQLSQHIDTIERITLTFAEFSAQQGSSDPTRARWIERHLDSDTIDFKIVSSPIDVAAHLQADIWEACAGAVITSATITSFGNFHHFSKQVGLNQLPQVKYLQLAPHFDYQNNAVLCVPNMRADPRNSDLHTAEIIRYLPDLLSKNSGNLVLFTSRKQMDAVYQGLSPKHQASILVQGQMPKGALLQTHRESISQGRASTIFGLATFSEGIDLPGNLCERVLISKLPFSVPVTPQEEASTEWLRKCGRDPFFEITLHEAMIVLNQQVGRLIRTEQDVGTVYILDKRILSKNYGKPILDSLPPFARDLGRPIVEYSKTVE